MGYAAIVEGALKALEIIDKYVDSPERRVKARREYFDSLFEIKKEILDEKDIEEMDNAINALLDLIHRK